MCGGFSYGFPQLILLASIKYIKNRNILEECATKIGLFRLGNFHNKYKKQNINLNGIISVWYKSSASPLASTQSPLLPSKQRKKGDGNC